MIIRCLIVFLFSISTVSATTFKLQDINQQISESQGIFIGNYLKSKSIKLDNGVMATQMYFKMTKEFGIQSDLFGSDEVIVHFPGGHVGDEHVVVEGVPEFVMGEKVALLLTSVDNRYWGLNLGMGTFKVVSFGYNTILINSLFPNDSRIGQVKIEDFEKAVRILKGENLKIVSNPISEVTEPERKPASVVKGKKRSLASKNEQLENISTGPVISNYWLILIFALLGGLFRITRSSKAK